MLSVWQFKKPNAKPKQPPFHSQGQLIWILIFSKFKKQKKLKFLLLILIILKGGLDLFDFLQELH